MGHAYKSDRVAGVLERSGEKLFHFRYLEDVSFVLNVVYMGRAECKVFWRSRDFGDRAQEYLGQIALSIDSFLIFQIFFFLFLIKGVFSCILHVF